MKRIFIAGLLLCALALSAASKPEPDGRTIVTAALNGPTGIGLIRLMDQPPAWAEQDSLQYQVVIDPRLIVPSLLKGEVDAAVVPANMAALVTAKGAPYRIAAIVGYGVLYVVGSGEAGESMDLFKGDTLHLSGKGATPDYLTQYFIEQSQLTAGEDIQLDYSFTHPDLTKALITGRVDQALLPEPFASTALMGNEDLNILLDYQQLWEEEYSTNYPISVLLVSDKMIEEKNDLLDPYLEAYKKSIQWVNAHPSEAAALVPQYGFTLSEEVLIEAIPRCNLQYTGMKKGREELEEFFSVLYALNPASIGGSLPGEDVYLP